MDARRYIFTIEARHAPSSIAAKFEVPADNEFEAKAILTAALPDKHGRYLYGCWVIDEFWELETISERISEEFQKILDANRANGSLQF